MKITVVGGGTSGLTTALYLDAHDQNNEIVLIYSNKIPIIGVGEGTTEHWRAFTESIGIPFKSYIKECDATFKNGVKFIDWTKDYYCHYLRSSINLSHISGALDIQKLIYNAPNIPFESMYNNKQDRIYISSESNDWILPNQLHFDAQKLNSFLKSKCHERSTNPPWQFSSVSKKVLSPFNIIVDDIVDVIVDDNGISELKFENGDTHESDLYIDCTGFKRLLIDAVGGKWVSHSDHLLTNKAIPFHTTDLNIHHPWTSAKAMNTGWMWEIPTQTRTGRGYVFSGNHISDDEARDEIRQMYPDQELNLDRVISFDPGKLENCAIKNVVAIGLSSNFYEPMEATNITAGICLLSSLMRGINYYGTQKYYDYVNNAADKICDNFSAFIQMHYLVEREDTSFWKSVKHDTTAYDLVIEFVKEANKYGCISSNYFTENDIQYLFGVGSFNMISYFHGLLNTVENNKFLYYCKSREYLYNLIQKKQTILDDIGPWAYPNECLEYVKQDIFPYDIKEKWNW